MPSLKQHEDFIKTSQTSDGLLRRFVCAIFKTITNDLVAHLVTFTNILMI